MLKSSELPTNGVELFLVTKFDDKLMTVIRLCKSGPRSTKCKKNYFNTSQLLVQITQWTRQVWPLTFGQRYWADFCMSETSRLALSAASALCVGPRPWQSTPLLRCNGASPANHKRQRGCIYIHSAAFFPQKTQLREYKSRQIDRL